MANKHQIHTIGDWKGTAVDLKNLVGIAESTANKLIREYNAGKITQERVFRQNKRTRIFTVGEEEGSILHMMKLYSFMHGIAIDRQTMQDRLLAFELGELMRDEVFEEEPEYMRGNDEFRALSEEEPVAIENVSTGIWEDKNL